MSVSSKGLTPESLIDRVHFLFLSNLSLSLGTCSYITTIKGTRKFQVKIGAKLYTQDIAPADILL